MTSGETRSIEIRDPAQRRRNYLAPERETTFHLDRLWAVAQ